MSTINHLPSTIVKRLKALLANVGDMALKRRARRIIEELNPQEGDKIVDVGCGNGYYSYLLSRLPVDIKIVGVDNSKEALSDAEKFITGFKKTPEFDSGNELNLDISSSFRGKGKVKLVLSNVYKLPFEKNSFDKAVMSEVIEHLDKPVDALKEVKRILKPSGVLVLTTTSREFPFLWDPINWTLERLFSTHIKSGYWAGIWNQHDKLFTDKELARIVKKSGLKIVILENLTYWSPPFNHYLLNLAAKMLYDEHLPEGIADSISKFRNRRKPFWIRFIYWFVNTLDGLNDIFPRKKGVSIFVKAIYEE